jgi:hypothetical protein
VPVIVVHTHEQRIGVILFLRGAKGRFITSSVVGIGEKVASLGAWSSENARRWSAGRWPSVERKPMEDSTTKADKRIVEELNFGSKTAKRVGWEQFEFGVEAPHLVRVTNASYGCEKDDHSYLVGIDDRDGLLVPSECGCPADKYNEERDCKHKVALATIAGPVVLQASVDCPNPTNDTEGTDSKTVAERLRADGGVIAEEQREDGAGVIEAEREECPNGEDWCQGPGADSLPCFACFELSEQR